MLFTVYCKDKPDALELRTRTRSDHLDFIAASNGKVKAAGPLLTDDGSAPIGSLLIVEADSLGEAQGWAALDPYARAGLFASVEIHPFSWVINNPEDA